MKNALFHLLSALLMAGFSFITVYSQDLFQKSPVPQPYPYLSGKTEGKAIPESPDPLVNYRWSNPTTADVLEVFLIKPTSVQAFPKSSFGNLESLKGTPNTEIRDTGSIRIDFGVEMGAWVEFDSPDCPGGVEMSISEYNETGVDKTAIPVRYGNTWRLELNKELYDGVRFAFIHVKSFTAKWHITGIRAVCQVKPANYNGSFSCSDPVLTRAWYLSAYGVRASLCKDYFGAILMDRGDRMSWTGDAHTSQAASLVAFGNFDFIKKNIDNTSGQSNGIRSYSLYWVLSLLDYYQYTGDHTAMTQYLDNACKKLDDAYKVFGTNPDLHFYGWDERLCAGFEIWFKKSPEAENAYKMLSIRVWQDFAKAMKNFGREDLQKKYAQYASEKIASLRKSGDWYATYGIHADADAINTGLLTPDEQKSMYNKWFTDRVNRLSLSPFNQYFIIQALARIEKYDDAISSVRDMWGGMADYGGTTPFECYRPSWNKIIGPNDAVPNTQSGITSLCHPWGAGVVKWLNEEILGIVPTSPGFKTWDILPHPGRSLKHVSGSTPTPLGIISASFDMTSGKCSISAPVASTGRIGIPETERTINRIMVNGKLAWDGTFHPVAGISGSNQDPEFIYFTGVKGGKYEIAVTYIGKTPVYQEQPETYAARFIKTDTITRGNWGGKYGRAGFILCNYNGDGTDKKSLPAYVTSVEYFRAFPKNGLPDPTLWAKNVSEIRAPAPDAGNGFPRNAACYSNSDQTMSVTIGMNGTKEYQIALYFLDWEKMGRRMAVEMFDAETLNLISPVKMVKDPSGGIYLVYSYNKSVKFRFDKIRGGNISLSGIFFD